MENLIDTSKILPNAMDASAAGGPIAVLLFTLCLCCAFVIWRLWMQNTKEREVNAKLRDRIEELQERRVSDAKTIQPSFDKLVEAVENLERNSSSRPTERTMQELIERIIEAQSRHRQR